MAFSLLRETSDFEPSASDIIEFNATMLTWEGEIEGKMRERARLTVVGETIHGQFYKDNGPQIYPNAKNSLRTVPV